MAKIPTRFYLIFVLFTIALIFGFLHSGDAWDTLPQDTGTLLTGDAGFYDGTALSISKGQGYALEGKPTCYYQPGYPAFLGAVFYFFGHSYRAVVIIQIILAIITFSMFLYLAECLFSAFSLFPALLYLSNYIIMSYVNTLMTETLALFLFMLLHFLLYRYLKTKNTYYILLLGICFAYLVLVRPIFQLYPICLLIILPLLYTLVRDNKAKFQILISIILFITISVLPPMFWMIRNNNLFGLFKLGAAGGYTLYQGVNPKYNGEYVGWKKVDDDLNISKRLVGHHEDIGSLSFQPQYIAKVDSILYAEAFKILKDKPLEAVRVLFKNISRLLYFQPFSNHTLSTQRYLLFLVNLFSSLCLLFGIIAVIIKKRNDKDISHLFIVTTLSLFLYYLCIHSFFTVDSRHGIYPLVQIYLLAPFFIYFLPKKWKRILLL